MAQVQNFDASKIIDVENLKSIINAIMLNDENSLLSLVYLPQEDRKIFWDNVEEVKLDLDFKDEDLTPFMRFTPREGDAEASLQVFLRSKESQKRDIMLFLILPSSKNRTKIMMGSICNVKKYNFGITCPSEENRV